MDQIVFHFSFWLSSLYLATWNLGHFLASLDYRSVEPALTIYPSQFIPLGSPFISLNEQVLPVLGFGGEGM